MKSIWFQYGEYGMKIFHNTTYAYFKIHSVYPTIHKELPEFLTSIGYPCKYDTTYVFRQVIDEDLMVEALGLTMDDETATALILRFGS